MNYDEWEKTISQHIRADSLWKMKSYRLATLLGDLAWHDVSKLSMNHRMLRLADQLYAAVGSIGANLAEGYSMGTGKNRARYYEYALGSARESRDWHNKARHVLDSSIFEHRMQVITEILRLLLTMVPQQRERTLRDTVAQYEIESNGVVLEEDASEIPGHLLQNIPLS